MGFEINVNIYYIKESNGYIVVINGEVFEMSSNAASPSGVNMYAGKLRDYPQDLLEDTVEREYYEVPFGVQKAILRRISDMLS